MHIFPILEFSSLGENISYYTLLLRYADFTAPMATPTNNDHSAIISVLVYNALARHGLDVVYHRIIIVNDL